MRDKLVSALEIRAKAGLRHFALPEGVFVVLDVVDFGQRHIRISIQRVLLASRLRGVLTIRCLLPTVKHPWAVQVFEGALLERC